MKRPATSKIKRPPSSPSSILGKKSYMTTNGEREYFDSSSEDSLMVVKKLVPSLKTSNSSSSLRVKTSVEAREPNNNSTMSTMSTMSTLSVTSITSSGSSKDLLRSASASALLKIPTLSPSSRHNSSPPKKVVIPPAITFKMITPENIVHILDYYGGEFKSCVSKDSSIVWSKFFKTWYGRFFNGITYFLFRYGEISEYKNSIVDEISYLYAAQLPFGVRIMESPLVEKLCFCPYKFTSTDQKVATIVREADEDMKKKTLRRLDFFRARNRYLCDNLQLLRLSQIQTFWEVVEKCFEIFPNFEVLKIGYIDWKTPNLPKFAARSYSYKDSLPYAIAKSNRKCKKIESRGFSHFITPKTASCLPLLEEYKTVYSCSTKKLKDIGFWKNLKILDCNLRGFQGNNPRCEESIPEFFKSLAQCKKLEALRIQDDCLYADEFKYLANAFPRLKYLNLYQSKIDIEIMEIIGTFTKLNTLILSENFDDERIWLEYLTNLHDLEYLEISGGVNAFNFMAVCKLTSLKTLSIRTTVGNNVGKELTQLTKLEQLELYGDKSYKEDNEPFTHELVLFLYENLKHVKRFNIHPHYSVDLYNHIPLETLKILQTYMVKRHNIN